MAFMPIDGSHGWADRMWRMLTDGGVWGIPRCGLMYRKEEAAKRLVLYARMPYDPAMPGTAEDLRGAQDFDHKGITDLFAAIGVEVVDDTHSRAVSNGE